MELLLGLEIENDRRRSYVGAEDLDDWFGLLPAEASEMRTGKGE